MAFYLIQSTFNKGELTPLLRSRSDLDHWKAGLHTCTNWHVLRHGGLRRRSGTRYIAEVKFSDHATRLLPFRFSASQSYVIEFGYDGVNAPPAAGLDGYFRFIADRGVVVTAPSTPYETNHRFLQAELFEVQWVHSADVTYMAHKERRPGKLTRFAETEWTWDNVFFDDGPYQERVKKARLTLSGLGVPAGTPLAGYETLFDNDRKTIKDITGLPFIVYLHLTTAAIVKNYTIIAGNDDADVQSPASWLFVGSHDGVVWITLDGRDGESGWGVLEARYYSCENEEAFEYYGIKFKSPTQNAVLTITIAEIIFGEWGGALTATIQDELGVNNDNGFQANDDGRLIGFSGSDGQHRWARITAVNSTLSVDIEFYGWGLEELTTLSWQLGAWSNQSGWPGCAALYSERIAWARTDDQPSNVWFSKSGSLDQQDYGTSTPPQDDDGIDANILASEVNEILWLTDGPDLIIGNAGDIRTIGPSDSGSPFSQTNIIRKAPPTLGASPLRPIKAGSAILYATDDTRRIAELVYSFEANSYVSPELSVLSEHYFHQGIVDWAWAQSPTPTVYAATGDGYLIAITYDQLQQVVGFSRFEIGGSFGNVDHGIVESVCVVPSGDGYDDLYMIVKRTINGATVRYIEVMEREFVSDLTEVEDACFLDSALLYDGSPALVISGLTHLAGETVGVWADGVVQPDEVVTAGGRITLSDRASKVLVGKRYRSYAKTLPVAGPQQDGTLFGRRRKVQAAHVDLLDAGRLKIGTDEETTAVLTYESGQLMDAPMELREGFFKVLGNFSWAGGGHIVMETDDPVPVTIRSLVLQVEGEP